MARKIGCRHCSGFNRTSNLFKLARNFSLSILNVLKHAAKTGEIIAKREVIAERLEKCRICEFRMTRDRCSKCGCFIVAKTGLEAEKCPDGQW